MLGPLLGCEPGRANPVPLVCTPHSGPKNLTEGALHEVSGPSSLYGTTTIANCIFSGYSPRCGQVLTSMSANPLSTDVSHTLQASAVQYEPALPVGSSPPLLFSATTESTRSVGTAFGVSLATCATPLGCDAGNHRLVLDNDGSLIGAAGTATSVMSRCAANALLQRRCCGTGSRG